jgi:hypothetical protein
MNWDRTGQVVRGVYLGQTPYLGKIVNSRVKYGGNIQHTVQLFNAIDFFGEARNRIFVRETDQFSILEE